MTFGETNKNLFWNGVFVISLLLTVGIALKHRKDYMQSRYSRCSTFHTKRAESRETILFRFLSASHTYHVTFIRLQLDLVTDILELVEEEEADNP